MTSLDIEQEAREFMHARMAGIRERPADVFTEVLDPEGNSQGLGGDAALWHLGEEMEQEDWSAVAEEAEKVAAKYGAKLHDGLRDELCSALLNAKMAAVGASLALHRGEVPDRPVVFNPKAIDPITLQVPPMLDRRPVRHDAGRGQKMSGALPDFLQFMVDRYGWRGQTKMQAEITYRMFMEWCGDRAVSIYTREHTAAFFDMLRRLPTLHGKDRRWRGLTLAQVVQRSQGSGAKLITMKTIKRHMSALGSFFTYAKDNAALDTGDNPAHGFSYGKKAKRGEKSTSRKRPKARKMWHGEKLTKLFKSPVWTGCQRFQRSRPGDKIIRDARFWLPILGLYHGNRLEEFAQLRREDVRQQGDIWYFDIHDEGDRQVKNEQSIRRVPLHSIVIRLGFVEYAEKTAPKPSDRVFPELRPGGPDRKLGFYFSKWFTAYRRAVGVYEPGLDYHSFRHGMQTKLAGAGISQAIVGALIGHEGKGTGETEYLHREALPLATLTDAVAKVAWPEVKLVLEGLCELR